MVEGERGAGDVGVVGVLMGGLGSCGEGEGEGGGGDLGVSMSIVVCVIESAAEMRLSV